MYPSSALLGQNKDEALAVLNVDELIEKADGFAGVFPGNISLCNLTINQKGLSTPMVSYIKVEFHFFLL